MDKLSLALAAAVAACALVFAADAVAQDKQMYKYTDADGHVVYTDKLPPSTAKNVQPKKLTSNVIETNAMPLQAQIASEKYPVTLYTYDCGDLCRNAEAVLNRRGVPFTTVNVADPNGLAKLQALTGDKTVPVLQVGDKLVSKGLSEARWQAMLDEAGYPKTPPPRRTTPAAPKEAATKGEATAQAPQAPATPPAATGGGYPK